MKKKRTHLRTDKFFTFDIETTTIITGLDKYNDPIRNAIIWSGQFYDGIDYIQVRSLKDVIKRLQIIEDENKEESPYKILCIVHNLSYEFQFIKDFFKWEHILCTDERKIIAAETKQIVFRCSYFLSNMGLDRFLKNENVPEEFQKSTMKYDIMRYPWTPLTVQEQTYCKNDVVGLHIAIQNRINHEYNQDLNNLPLTSTGYVRKDCRKAVTDNKSNRWRFIKERLDYETFKMNHTAFRGGNTHANRYHVNKVLKRVGSDDERSAYPAAAILYDMPTVFCDMKPYKQKEFDYYLKHWKQWAMLIEVNFKELELINPAFTPIPYISASKCDILHFYTDEDKEKNKILHAKQVDNGKLLRCKYCSMTITEIDYMLIKKQYKAEEERISKVKVAVKKPIQKELKQKILDYYYKKTSLKQDEDDPNWDADIDYMYKQSKAGVNGIYGMHVTNPCKPEYVFNEETNLVEQKKYYHEEDNPDSGELTEVELITKLLDDYYESYSSFLSYQVGVWITSYARMMLEAGIQAINESTEGYPDHGCSDMVYCDTDSIKYLHPERHQEAIAAINKERIKLAEERGAYVDYKGKRYHLGVFENEGTAKDYEHGFKYYKLFKTFGAKKYMVSSPHGGFEITISGVPKRAGADCIKKDLKRGKLKSPFDIKKGYVFHSIKTTSCYMDHTKMHEYEIDGKKVYYGSNVAMYPNSYTLGLTYDFEILLDQYKDIMED